jgi:hypothetical protein
MEHAAPDLGDCGLRWVAVKTKEGTNESRHIESACGQFAITHYTIRGADQYFVKHGKDLIAIKDSAQLAKDYARDYKHMEP